MAMDPHLASVSIPVSVPVSASSPSPSPTTTPAALEASTAAPDPAPDSTLNSTSSALPQPPPPVFSAPSSPQPDSTPVSPAGSVAAAASPSSPSQEASQQARSTALFSASSSTSPFRSTGIFNRTGSAKRAIRRQSTQDRLDEILETARNRAESYSAAEAASAAANPSNANASARRATVGMEPLLRNQSAPGAFSGIAGIAEQYEGATADETTRIKGGSSSSRRGNATTTSTYGSVSLSSPAFASRSSSGPRARIPVSDAAGPAARGASRTVSRAASLRHQGAAAAGATGAAAGAAPSRWSEFWAGFQCIELENKGSVARDHLALERTFLAWLRTSLAFASIGIAVTQLFRLNTLTDNDGSGLDSLRHVGRPLGTTFLGISVLILFLGYHRFYQSQQWILQGKFPASRGTILVVSLVAFALMVSSLVVVWVAEPWPS